MKKTYQIMELLTGIVWQEEMSFTYTSKGKVPKFDLHKIFNSMTHSRMHLKTFIENCEKKQIVHGFQFSYKEEK